MFLRDKGGAVKGRVKRSMTPGPVIDKSGQRAWAAPGYRLFILSASARGWALPLNIPYMLLRLTPGKNVITAGERGDVLSRACLVDKTQFYLGRLEKEGCL